MRLSQGPIPINVEQKKIRAIVENVIQDVRKNGDRALIKFAKKFDKVSLSKNAIRVPVSRLKDAVKRIADEKRKAIEACARRIQEFHWEERKHVPQSWTTSKGGVRLGQIYNAIASVGIYVPGGRFAYPSTVLMTAIPARLAGVERIAIVTPPARLSDEILAAAQIAGVKEIYQVGGPAAVAALALGTSTIPKVDLIVGPGNAFVTEAKRQLFGEVGIDLLAGPSELVVVADDSADAACIASDMAAQAEHDPDSKSILISTSKALIKDTKENLAKAIHKQCDFYFFADIKKAVAKANDCAGEHVELMVRRPQDCLDTLKNGGTFFIGKWSPTAMGDYWAGPSHVLPTGRSARFGSGLSVMTFLRRSSLVEISSAAYARGWTAAHQVAELEGLVQHARSLRIRMNEEI